LHSSVSGDQAFGLWCEWSQQSDKFDLKDQRRVWDSFKQGGGVTLATLFGIAKQAGWVRHDYARKAKNSGTVSDKKGKVVIAQGNHESTPDVGMLQRYVFLKNSNRILDIVTRNELTRDGFDGAYMHLFHDQKPSSFFLKNPAAIKVDGFIYLPGESDNPVRRGGAVLWNIWFKPDVEIPDKATDDDIQLWLEHLGYLYPDSQEQAHILDWMAHTLQHPEIKINHALLIAGTMRVGKDLLLNPLRYGLGEANVSEPPAGELKESFTDYLHHSKLVIFQEIQTFEGLNLENKLKPMLSAPPNMLRVRLFGRGFYETPNIVQVIFMSNYRDALHISEGDGRYFTVWADSKPLSADYYKTLGNWLDGAGCGAVVRWLLSRDIHGFNPYARAPSSSFKVEMVANSKSPLKHLLQDMIDAEDWPFNVDCVRSVDVAKVLQNRCSTKAIGSVLSEIGCTQQLCKYSKEGRKSLSLYAVRDHAAWGGRAPIEWIAEYEQRSGTKANA